VLKHDGTINDLDDPNAEKMREIVFWIGITAAFAVFTLLLELRVEEAIGVSWYLPFVSLWVALGLYLLWICWFFRSRTRHWRVLTIGIGIVVLFQSIAIPVILDNTMCGITDPTICSERRTWISRVVLIPLFVVEVMALLYMIRDYLWMEQVEKDVLDSYTMGMEQEAKHEWSSAEIAADAEKEWETMLSKASIDGEYDTGNADSYIYDE
jgi:hypothetical protein